MDCAVARHYALSIMSHTMRLKWWGWGLEDKRLPLPNADLSEALRRDLQVDFREIRPPSLETITLEDPVPIAGALTDKLERVLHARGKSTRDLLELRQGGRITAPDGVVYPESEAEILEVLTRCRKERIAVVPFGGGTSVVGGVEPLKETHRAVLCLDLTRMNRLLDFDARSLTATIEAGARGPEIQKMLEARGATLEHVPQSFEFSTLGGWLATRSAGEFSTRYGKIEDMAVSVTVALPDGVLTTTEVPAHASGPELRELFVGGEGVFGIITRAVVRVNTRSGLAWDGSFLFPDFEAGVEALRQMMHQGAVPSLARLLDFQETRFSILAGRRSGLSQAVIDLFLKLKRFKTTDCLLLLTFEGESAKLLGATVKYAIRLARRLGGRGLGGAPVRKFYQQRFDLPYLRDELLNLGILVETLETATRWSNLLPLYRAIQSAFDSAQARLGRPILRFCHVSHLYRDGASLYFTFLTAPPDGLAAWTLIKDTVTEAIVTAGGTVSHHHGVGIDHKRWLPREKGELYVALLRRLKSQVDPDGILNPGKLLP